MAEDRENGRSPLWRLARIVALSTLQLFLGGVVAGMIAAHVDKGGGMPGLRFFALQGVALALLAGCGWLLLRDLRRARDEEPLTRKERLNRNILVGSGALGAAMAVAAILSADSMTAASVYSNAPLPPLVAAVFVAVFLLILPPLTLYWQKRAVDEQEIDAYKSGALAAVQVYMIGAPAWWFAWRGGFAPEPNGVAIYMIVTFTMLIVWLGKKYG
ncbi:MAG: hypothetical protein ACK40O_08300 [Allosphingosinicella sp.]